VHFPFKPPRLGRDVAPEQLRLVFRHLQFSRVVNRHGNVSIHRIYIYAERGLSKHRVTLWFYQDRLHVEYRQTLLARYHYHLPRRATKVSSISRPKLYKTTFASPQLELLELDDAHWQKIAQRPEYAKRRKALAAAARQLAFDLPLMSWLFFWR